MLTHFLTKAPISLGFLKRGIIIEPNRLQSVSKGLRENLSEACKFYVEGIIDMDKEFLKGTTAPYLFSKIQGQIDQLGEQETRTNNSPQRQFARRLNVEMSKQKPTENLNLKKQNVQIFPYVVFGALASERINIHPYQSATQVTRNRFFQAKNLNDISNKHTYGFKCEFKTEQKLGHRVILTLQGNIDTNEYYVVDLANQFMGGVL